MIFQAYLLFFVSSNIGTYGIQTKECEPSQSLYLKHETDAQLYFMCVNGEAILVSCPDGYIFDQARESCIKSRNTESNIICPPTPECNILDAGKLKPFPPNCTQYIYCSDFNQPILSTCPQNEHFNPTTLTCGNPATAGCPNCVVQNPSIDYCPQTPICYMIDVGKFKPYPPDCSKYIYCDPGLTGIISACPKSMKFDPTEKVCSETSNCTDCIERPIGVCPPIPTCNVFESGQVKPYPLDCNKYIYCNTLGDTILSSCPNGQHFDVELNRCEEASIANCTTCMIDITTSTIADTTVTETSTTSTTTTTTTTTSTTTTTTTSTTTTPPTTTTRLPDCPPAPKCYAEDNNNRLPYPPSCQMYIKCKRNSPEEYWSCPTGKEFSVATNWCEFENIAQCFDCYYNGTLPPTQGTESAAVNSYTVAMDNQWKEQNKLLMTLENKPINVEDVMVLYSSEAEARRYNMN